MWICPVCGTIEQNTLHCSQCGFDGSMDREQHPTLIDPGMPVASLVARREQYNRQRQGSVVGSEEIVQLRQRVNDLEERLARLEQKMAATEQKAEVRAQLETQFVPSASEETQPKKIAFSEYLQQTGSPEATPVQRTENGTVLTITDLDRYTATDKDKETVKKLFLQAKGTQQEVKEYAFEDFEALTEVTMTGDWVGIGDSAFAGCYQLCTIAIPDSVRYIECMAFGCCDFEKITFPKSLSVIGMYAFSGNDQLTEIIFPASLTQIGDKAFADCEQLAKVTFLGDRSKIKIAANAFEGAPYRLTEVQKEPPHKFTFSEILNSDLTTLKPKPGVSVPAMNAARSYDVVLTDIGANKISVIKAVREITGLGLKEAKDLVEAAPVVIKKGASATQAGQMKNKFTAVGAKVEIR